MDRDLVFRAMQLKEEIAAKEQQLKELNAQIYDSANFGEGKTYSESFDFGKVKVSKSTRVTWDQSLLAKARAELGDKDFFDLFKWTFNHRDIRSINDYLKWQGQKALPIANAMKKSEGYSVSFERIE